MVMVRINQSNNGFFDIKIPDFWEEMMVGALSWCNLDTDSIVNPILMGILQSIACRHLWHLKRPTCTEIGAGSTKFQVVSKRI